MADNNMVRAPNGITYRLHRQHVGSGYVYADGHRIYGRVRHSEWGDTLVLDPYGKWAHLLRAAAVPA
jgi:hypothetical protein